VEHGRVVVVHGSQDTVCEGGREVVEFREIDDLLVFEERLLEAEGKTRHDLGREQFIERVWEWKATSGNRITTQMRTMGFSTDWTRERFTFDEGLSKAVRKVFVTLYEEGLIYRGNRIINWCPRCHTALSEIEVEHEDETGELTHIKYPFVEGDGYITVATTRPETMLGDTAVAVHPDDERYRDAVGRTLLLPLLDREIPVVADEGVELEFGTGAVKVTPAHDPLDFEIGQRHGLDQIQVIDTEAKITEHGGPFAGQDRFEAREAVRHELKKRGFLERIDEHHHSVGHCSRCGTVVEPMLSLQWFVKVEPLATLRRCARCTWEHRQDHPDDHGTTNVGCGERHFATR